VTATPWRRRSLRAFESRTLEVALNGGALGDTLDTQPYPAAAVGPPRGWTGLC
jgi:hypothetical protein